MTDIDSLVAQIANITDDQLIRVLDFLEKNRQFRAATETFQDWLGSADNAENALRQRALSHQEEYFQDMLMLNRPYNPTTNLDGVQRCIFKIDPNLPEDRPAKHSRDPRMIKVRDENCPDSHLLHEMLHVYDTDLFCWPFHRDVLMIQLYLKLSHKYPPLSHMLLADAKYEMTEVGHDQRHTRLFALKSLDLDNQIGEPPGTVYGYEMTAFYSQFL